MHEKTDLPQPGVWHIPGSGQTTITIDLVHEYNKITPSDQDALDRLLRRIIHPASGPCRVQPPMMIEYGVNTTIGPNTFINFGVTILDTTTVTIGEWVQIGPNCNLITVTHPVDDYEMRREGWEIAHPITIGNGVWLGANVTVLPGVTIGDNAVIGAGSVVTKDIPANAIAMGVPARVTRFVDPQRSERDQLREQ